MIFAEGYVDPQAVVSLYVLGSIRLNSWGRGLK